MTRPLAFETRGVLTWLGKNAVYPGPLVKSSAQVGLSQAITGLANLVSGILVQRWVSPQDMGIWNGLLLSLTYSQFMQLGILNGLGRELPFMQARQEHDKATTAAGTAYAVVLSLTACSVVVTILLTCVLVLRQDHTYAVSLTAVGLMIIVSWLNFYHLVLFRANGDFGRLSAADIAVALSGLVLLACVYAFGYWGHLLRMAAKSLILAALYFLLSRRYHTRPLFDSRMAWQLIKTGAPIFLVGQLWGVFVSMDSVSLVSSQADLGYYTLALQVHNAARIFPIAITSVVYPAMAHRYGATGSTQGLVRMAWKATAGASLIGLVVGIAGCLAVPQVVKHITPQYALGVPAAVVASFSGLAMAPHLFAALFNVLRRQELYLIGWIGGLASFLFVRYTVAGYLGMDVLVGTSLGMVTGTFVFSVLTMLLSLGLDRRK